MERGEKTKFHKFLILLYSVCLIVNILGVLIDFFFYVTIVIIGFIVGISFGAIARGYRYWSFVVLLPSMLVSIISISMLTILCGMNSLHSFCVSNKWIMSGFPLYFSLTAWFSVSICLVILRFFYEWKNKRLKINRIIVVHYEGKLIITSLEERGSNYSYGEPVHTTEVDLDQMTKVIEDVLHTLDIQYPISQIKKGQVGKDPILTATGAKGWEDLCEKGSMYTITWLKKEKHIDFWQMNSNKLLETVPERTRCFTGNATIQTPTQMIVEDILSFKA